MRSRWYRYLSWGDRKHWEFSVGRVHVSRWCSGAPCGLPGVAPGPHWIRVGLLNPAGSARQR